MAVRTPDDLRQQIPKWSLESDGQLLQYMISIAKNLEEKCQHTQDNLNRLMLQVNETEVKFANATNQFTAIEQVKYVENRVEDDDESFYGLRRKRQAEERQQKQDKENRMPLEDVLQLAVKQSINGMCNSYEKVTLELGNDSSDDEDDGGEGAGNRATIMRAIPKYPFNHRPLPYTIGTKEWHDKWHVGVIDSDEESDTEPKEEYSESSSESDGMFPSQPNSNHTPSESESSIWGTNSEAFHKRLEPGSISGDDGSSIYSYASSSKPKVQIPPSYPRIPVLPPTHSLKPPNLFPEEPPEEDSGKASTSATGGLFEESEPESEQPTPVHLPRVIAGAAPSFFKGPQPERKTVNLFFDEPPLDTQHTGQKKAANLFIESDEEQDTVSSRGVRPNSAPYATEPPALPPPKKRLNNIFDDDDVGEGMEKKPPSVLPRSVTTSAVPAPSDRSINGPGKRITNLFDDEPPVDDFEQIFKPKPKAAAAETAKKVDPVVPQPAVRTVERKKVNLFDDDDEENILPEARTRQPAATPAKVTLFEGSPPTVNGSPSKVASDIRKKRSIFDDDTEDEEEDALFGGNNRKVTGTNVMPTKPPTITAAGTKKATKSLFSDNSSDEQGEDDFLFGNRTLNVGAKKQTPTSQGDANGVVVADTRKPFKHDEDRLKSATEKESIAAKLGKMTEPPATTKQSVNVSKKELSQKSIFSDDSDGEAKNAMKPPTHAEDPLKIATEKRSITTKLGTTTAPQVTTKQSVNVSKKEPSQKSIFSDDSDGEVKGTIKPPTHAEDPLKIATEKRSITTNLRTITEPPVTTKQSINVSKKEPSQKSIFSDDSDGEVKDSIIPSSSVASEKIIAPDKKVEVQNDSIPVVNQVLPSIRAQILKKSIFHDDSDEEEDDEEDALFGVTPTKVSVPKMESFASTDSAKTKITDKSETVPSDPLKEPETNAEPINQEEHQQPADVVREELQNGAAIKETVNSGDNPVPPPATTQHTVDEYHEEPPPDLQDNSAPPVGYPIANDIDYFLKTNEIISKPSTADPSHSLPTHWLSGTEEPAESAAQDTQQETSSALNFSSIGLFDDMPPPDDQFEEQKVPPPTNYAAKHQDEPLDDSYYRDASLTSESDSRNTSTRYLFDDEPPPDEPDNGQPSLDQPHSFKSISQIIEKRNRNESSGLPAKPHWDPDRPKVNKLNAKIAINVAALLPGARRQPSAPSWLETESAPASMAPQFTTEPEASGKLTGLNKGRARIPAKRKPPSRLGRRANVSQGLSTSSDVEEGGAGESTAEDRIVVGSEVKAVHIEATIPPPALANPPPASVPPKTIKLFTDDASDSDGDELFGKAKATVAKATAAKVIATSSSKSIFGESDDDDIFSQQQQPPNSSSSTTVRKPPTLQSIIPVAVAKKPASQPPAKSLFGSDEDDDEEDNLFGSAAKPKMATAAARIIGKATSSNIFGDDEDENDDDDLFGSRKTESKAVQQRPTASHLPPSSNRPAGGRAKIIKAATVVAAPVDDPLADLLDS